MCELLFGEWDMQHEFARIRKKTQNEIMAAYHKNLPKHSMDFSFFTDFEKVKYQIIYKLINYEQVR